MATPDRPPATGRELLDLYYFDMRKHLLEFAAALDRIERAGGADGDPRLDRLMDAARIAVGPGPDRARRFLERLSV